MENRGPAVFAVTASFTVISTIFVAFRMLSRIGIVRRVQWDDYFMISAWLIAVGMSISLCYGTTVGLGRHQSDIPDEWEPPLKKAEYAFSVLYNPALMATKTSILIFYLTLSKSMKVFRWACIATFAVVNVAGLALTLLNVLQCSPVGAALAYPVPESAKCTDIITLYLSSAPVNIITDLALLFLPMPVLTSMRLPKKQKIILVITFGFGVFVAVVDVVRITYLQEVSMARLANIQNSGDNSGADARNSSDFPWYASLSFMWSVIEVHVGIMCACVPALKPLVSRFLPQFIRDVGERTAYGSQTGSPPLGRGSFAATQPLPPVAESSSRPGDSGHSQGTQSQNSTEKRGEQGGDIGIMDFLTIPDMTELPEHQTSPTIQTYDTRQSRRTTVQPDFYDFVNVPTTKSFVDLTNKESIFPITMVTLLFFLWGFAYGLLDTLNAQFQVVAHMSSAQSIGLHSAYFTAYFLGPITFGRLVLKHWGFKACYNVGLVTYACGTLVFWPSAVLTSFPAFLISNFIVGLGLSTLEIAANPFTALCGPAHNAEIRLNLSQGFQAIGSVCSPLLMQKVLFGKVKNDAPSLVEVQWAYLGIALFTILLAVAFYYVPLPEASDDDFERVCIREDGANDAVIGGIPVLWWTLGLGVFSQFCYVGGQEATATGFNAYMDAIGSKLNRTDHQAIGHTAFAVSRFIAAAVNIWIKPRWTLLFFYAGAIAFSAASMNFSGATPEALIIMLYFFEGPIFAFIYATALRGQGRNTKDAAAMLTSAIGGGAVFPPIRNAVANAKNDQYAFCVVLASFVFGSVWAIYLNVIPAAKKQVDPTDDVRESNGRQQRHDSVMSMSRERRPSTVAEFMKRKGWGREKDEEAGLPSREHGERASQEH